WAPVPASSCCCQARNLPWAPVPPPHAAARPVICHGPLYRLLMLLPGSRVCHGPCTASPIAAVSIATLCHVPLSSGLLTLLVGSIFVYRVLYGLPLLLPHRRTVAPHSGFGPVTAPNE
ncbi:unnamed protein product, partial [Staurois parvus]